MWNTIAWNGVSFQKPADWEIATIGHSYLMLGTRFEPRMEISWRDIPTSFSQTRHQKKLYARLQHQHRAPVQPWTPAPEVGAAVSAYDANWFTCKSSDSCTYGCVLFCASCRRISMIQMFLKQDIQYEINSMAFILSSFQDHPAGNRRYWSVFDIRFILPSTFDLRSYQFSIGLIRLCFQGNQQDVTLYRWGPASTLLSGKSLSEFAVSLKICPQNAIEHVVDPHWIEFETEPVQKSRIVRLLLLRDINFKFYIRHYPETNRILAIKAESRITIDHNLFEQIISHYECSITQPD